MKQFKIELAKKVIATFTMDYDEFKIKFGSSVKLAAFIREKRPELIDCSHHATFPNNDIVIEFYSVGDAVITEA